ncbi:hypothetical protein ACIQMJ_29670 [Actinosynnema sp. NPDC091369]
MSVWWAAAVLSTTTLSGLVAKWMMLRFLHRVYERGGAKDLKAAAEALRELRSHTTAKELVRARIGRTPAPRGRRAR